MWANNLYFSWELLKNDDHDCKCEKKNCDYATSGTDDLQLTAYMVIMFNTWTMEKFSAWGQFPLCFDKTFVEKNVTNSKNIPSLWSRV